MATSVYVVSLCTTFQPCDSEGAERTRPFGRLGLAVAERINPIVHFLELYGRTVQIF